ncbi:S8 family serine peptidase [Planctomycetes bacterium K23_9]|uniref:Subtilase family protein n=1 Tax=Stieleria marina TaxID=1930275 RepID=A0A517NWP7_9BACT|nr:Subtilase family protein [Planctomycetes bacterium K23_9]
MTIRRRKPVASNQSRRGQRIRRLATERLEKRELLAADAFDVSFFAGSQFLQPPTVTNSATAAEPNVSANSQAGRSATIPAFQVDLPTKYEPVAQKIGQRLFDVFTAAEQASSRSTNSDQDAVALAAASAGILMAPNNQVAVEIVASVSIDNVRSDLESIEFAGFEERASFGKMISGSIDAGLLDELASLPSVNFVRPIHLPQTNVGSVDNEADKAMRTDIAKTTYGLDGGGIKIGVLSDSYDTIAAGGGAAGGIASGDLPGPGNPFGRTAPIQILQDLSRDGIDEGRAMLELIHDVAPEASLAFRTAFEGPVDFAAGILELANAGSDIIVDDITYFSQPFFQDGVIAQAAEQVVNQGIPFFSSAGNQGRESYESDFRSNGAQAVLGGKTYIVHDFDPGPGLDNFQTIAVAAGQTATLSFQWDQPFASSGGAGSANDMDIFVFDSSGTIVAASADSNIGGDAVEIIRIANPTAQSQIYELAMAQNISVGGPQPGRIKYYGTGSPQTFDAFEWNTFSGTLYGHHQAAGSAGIAAADYRKTPEFGTSPAQPQPSTSAGGVPILFDTAGNRLPQPVVRQQPVLTGPDNTNTTFFTVGRDTDGDGNPNFSGTSAAAPHIAAVAALMMEAAGGPGSLTPAQINTVLSQTALDMLTPGFDFDTGAGFVDAEAAIAAVAQDTTDTDYYFTALVGGNQRELHISDGTTAGTKMVRNLNGSNTAAVSDLAMINGTLVFSAVTETGQRELHRSRGTSASTFMVRNLAGALSSAPRDLTLFGNDVIFSAALSNGQRELYRTRGSAASTTLVRNLSGSRSSNPTDLTVVGDKLFFVATTEQGNRELHVTDGTASGTVLVRDLFGSLSSRPEELTAVANRLYFTAQLPSGERELFTSTGSSASTRQVENLYGTHSSSPQDLTAVGNRLYFTAILGSGERELHISQGTAANTRMVRNLGGTRSSSPQWLTARGNELFFVAALGIGQRELYKSNGTLAGTVLVENLAGTLSSSPSELTLVGDQIVFSARINSSQRELYKSDGTAANTGIVRNLSGATSASPVELRAVGDQVVFSAITSLGQRELHISDLTPAGTGVARNLNGSSSGIPKDIFPIVSAGAAGNSSNASGNSSNAAAAISNVGESFSPVALAAVPIRFEVDVDGSGTVTPLDALLVLNDLSNQANGETIGLPNDVNTDVNGDGQVSPADALAILNWLSDDTNQSRMSDVPTESVDEVFRSAIDEETRLEESLLF